jgi:hypothetical protein
MSISSGWTQERHIRVRLDMIKQIFGGNIRKALAKCASLPHPLVLQGFDPNDARTWRPQHLVGFTNFFSNSGNNIPWNTRMVNNPLGSEVRPISTHRYKPAA